MRLHIICASNSLYVIVQPCILTLHCPFFFFFNDTATTEIYTLSLHDALPISRPQAGLSYPLIFCVPQPPVLPLRAAHDAQRSEEHTSELQSLAYLVCRLLLEKKKHQMTSRQGWCSS